MTGAQARKTGGLLTALTLTAALVGGGLSARPSNAAHPRGTTTGSRAISIASDVDNGMYSIDLTTGEATLLGVVDFQYNPEGITFDPTFTNLFAVDSDADLLLTLNDIGEVLSADPIIDVDTGLPVDVDDAGLTFAPDGVTLLMATTDSDGVTVRLWALDLSGGPGVDVPATFIEFLTDTVTFGDAEIDGLGTDPATGTVYGLGTEDNDSGTPVNEVFIIDPTTGDATPLGDLGLPFFIADGGLDVDPTDGLIWGISDGEDPTDVDGVGDPVSHLFSVDPTTGLALTVLEVHDIDTGASLSGFENLAIIPGEVQPPDECSGAIQVRGQKLKFGTVQVGRGHTRSFQIKNVSDDEDLFVSVGEPSNDAFFILNEETEGTLGPGERVIIAVRFEPGGRGKHKGSITISSSDCDKGDQEVKLVGDAVRPKKRHHGGGNKK